MKEMQYLNALAWDWLKKDPKHFSGLHFCTNVKCDSMDNSMYGILNGTIIKARFKPFVSMLKEIYNKSIQRIVNRKEWIIGLNQAINPRIITKINKEKTKAR